MNTTYNLFQGFEDEVVASTQLPFCQIKNPPNMSLAQIKQFNPPMGWFRELDRKKHPIGSSTFAQGNRI